MLNAATGVKQEDMVKEVALRSLEDRICEALVQREEPAKTGELVKALAGDGVTMRLLRYALAESDRFGNLERKWVLASRFEDTQRPFEKVMERVLKLYGRPMSVHNMAKQIAPVFERPVEHYDTVLPRLLINQEKYFEIEDNYGLNDWLVLPTSEATDEVIFDNFLSEDEVEKYRPFAEGLDWEKDQMAALAQMLDKAGEPVPVKIAALLAWESLGSDYDPVDFYASVLADKNILLLSNQKMVGKKIQAQLAKALDEIAKTVEEMPGEYGEEAEGGPVEVTEADREEVVGIILKKGDAVSAADILDDVFEITEGESAFQQSLDNLMAALREDERVVWVGDIRFRPAGTIPDYVNEVPAELVIPPTAPYETPEGDVYDQELEDDGLEGSLKTEIFNPLVEDIGDEDPEKSSVQPNDKSQRCVLKYHHKEAGTFPLAQINPDFFGREPEIIQITLTDEGMRREAWVNNRTRLIYGMKDWYQGEWPVSGGVFEIEKTERPGEFRFVKHEDNDPMVHVPNTRLFELLELKNEAETTETPVFDIVTRIMDQHKKGVGFVTLFTEVNLVRRVTRRVVASILSSYHAFYQRPKTTEWQYDEKKRSQGFNKAKRKYIKK